MTTIHTHPRPGPRPRLGVEPLESRCTCSVGILRPPALLPPPPPPGLHHAPPPEALPPGALPAAGAKVQSAAPRVVATGPHLTVRAGERFEAVVAHVEGIKHDRVAARIDWGNGVRSDGVVRPLAGDVPGFDVIGHGHYDAPGTFAMTVQLTPPGGGPVTLGGVAVVEPPVRPPVNAPTEFFQEPANVNSAPVPDAPPAQPQVPAQTTGPERTPGDTDGGVPWERQPDPRPADAVAGQPSPAAAVELPPVRTPAEAAPANGPAAEVPAGPAYLAQAAREPATAPIPAAAVLPSTIAGLRTVAGGAIESVELPVAVDLPTLLDRPTVVVADGVAVRAIEVLPPAEVAPAPEAPAAKATPKAERRVSVWRNGVAVGVALVFAERLIAARRGERQQRDRGATVVVGVGRPEPEGD